MNNQIVFYYFLYRVFEYS